MLKYTQQNLGANKLAMQEVDQTDQKGGGKPKNNKSRCGSGRRISTLTNKRKYNEVSQESWLSTAPEGIQKSRRVSGFSTPTSPELHKWIYTDLKEPARECLGTALYGDFWDAFISILDTFSNQSPGGCKPMEDQQIFSSWADQYQTKNYKVPRHSQHDRLCKKNVIRYQWDLAKNLVLCGLRNGDKYFTHLTEYAQDQKRISAWECLNIYIGQYIIEKGWAGSESSLRETLITSLKDPSPTTMDRQKLKIQNCQQFHKPIDIDEIGCGFFTEDGWLEIIQYLDCDNVDNESLVKQPIPKIHEIISLALKDFVKIIPENPDEKVEAGLTSYKEKLIRRTIATSEFNISSQDNKLHSEHTFAILMYPIVHMKEYGLKTEDIKQYLFLLSCVMILNRYYFIVVSKHPEKKELANKQLWEKEHKYNSIFPFLLTFIPGISSLPSGMNQHAGENIDYTALLRCFDLTGISEKSGKQYKLKSPDLSGYLPKECLKVRIRKRRINKGLKQLKEDNETLSEKYKLLKESNLKIRESLRNTEKELSATKKELRNTAEVLFNMQILECRMHESRNKGDCVSINGEGDNPRKSTKNSQLPEINTQQQELKHKTNKEKEENLMDSTILADRPSENVEAEILKSDINNSAENVQSEPERDYQMSISSIHIENGGDIPDGGSFSTYKANTSKANSSEKQAKLHDSCPETFAQRQDLTGLIGQVKELVGQVTAFVDQAKQINQEINNANIEKKIQVSIDDLCTARGMTILEAIPVLPGITIENNIENNSDNLPATPTGSITTATTQANTEIVIPGSTQAPAILHTNPLNIFPTRFMQDNNRVIQTPLSSTLNAQQQIEKNIAIDNEETTKSTLSLLHRESIQPSEKESGDNVNLNNIF